MAEIWCRSVGDGIFAREVGNLIEDVCCDRPHQDENMRAEGNNTHAKNEKESRGENLERRHLLANPSGFICLLGGNTSGIAIFCGGFLQEHEPLLAVILPKQSIQFEATHWCELLFWAMCHQRPAWGAVPTAHPA